MRVGITGIGLVTPLGTGTERTWEGLLDARSAVAGIRAYDPRSFRSRLGAEIVDFDPAVYVQDRRALRMMTRSDRFAQAASVLALEDAGFTNDDVPGDGMALFIGGDKEVSDPAHLVPAAEAARAGGPPADMQAFGSAAASEVYPLFYLEGLPGSAVFYLSQAFALTGPGAYFAGTAEAGVVAIGTAFRAIKRGDVELALAGATDDAVSWWNQSKLDGLEILTDQNDLGARACRPFDRDATGAVLGEGAAMYVLERLDRAQARGAPIHAEVCGFGSAMDTVGMTPDPSGRAVAWAIRAAADEGAIEPGDVGVVIADASGIVRDDRSEARGIRDAFGCVSPSAAITSVKAATGHLGAAAGALNVGIAALTLVRGCIPPTLNHADGDPVNRLNVVAGPARTISADYALALGRGAQGQCSTILLRRGPATEAKPASTPAAVAVR